MLLEKLLKTSKEVWDSIDESEKELLIDLVANWPITASKVVLLSMYPNMDISLLEVIADWENQPIWVQLTLILLTRCTIGA